MTGRAAEADARRGRDRAAMVLLLLAALGALFSFVDAVGATMVADPETRVTESWRMYGFVVFAGLFVLLAFRPRRSPGIWELVIFHKTAVAVTAAALVRGGAEDAVTVAAADGVLAVVLITAYVPSRGYSGWTMLRAGGAKTE